MSGGSSGQSAHNSTRLVLSTFTHKTFDKRLTTSTKANLKYHRVGQVNVKTYGVSAPELIKVCLNSDQLFVVNPLKNCLKTDA